MKIVFRLPAALALLGLAGFAGLAACGCDGHCAFARGLPDTTADPSASLPHAYLWAGLADFAPPCPPAAPQLLFDAYADLTAAPHTCPACTCGPSATTCKGPIAWEAVAAPCDGAPGASTSPFDAPASWNGICSTTTKIPDGKTCAGGALCAQSVAVQPPQATGEPCTPMAAGDGTKPEPAWKTLARICQKDLTQPVKIADDCRVEAESTGAYAYCVQLANATDACPDDYDDRHELFRAASDERTCSPCTCGPPQGGTCTVKLGAYSDEACESTVGSAYASSDGPPICFDVPDGTALLGKSAEPVASSAGQCAPGGGEPAGQVVPAQPVTWCCFVPSQ